MVLTQVINVGLTVKSSVHDQFDFVIPEEINVRQEILNRFNVGNVTCQLAVIKRQVGFFTEAEEIDFRRREALGAQRRQGQPETAIPG